MGATPPTARRRATLADLAETRGKAELIGGRIVRFGPAGHLPSLAAGRIFLSLGDHAEAIGVGEVYTGSIAFTVPELASGRESFSPDASYYVGPLPVDEMEFIPGPPTFAVEVRQIEDYGEEAEVVLAAKRADYFEAGTRVVWDVDPRARVVRSYRANTPERPTPFHPGEEADAEPAVPGWRLAVDRIFS